MPAPVGKNKVTEGKAKNLPKFPPLSPKSNQESPLISFERRHSSPVNFEPKGLGKIIKSNIIKNQTPISFNNEEVSEGSFVVDANNETSSLSHFEPV